MAYLDPGLVEDRLAETQGNAANDDRDDPFHDENWAYEDVLEHPKINTRGRDATDTPFEPSTSKTYAGSRNIPPEVKSYGQFLDLYFTDDIIQHFVENTNSYVARQEKPVWLPDQNIDALELKRFFGAILYMGIVQRPELKKYWEKSYYGDSFMKKLFGRDRFLAILYNLHWFDASEMSDEERQRRNREDGFWVLEDFYEALRLNFMKYFECGRFLSIDEMTIFFKGRHRCKCYNPNKPNKWHFKAYCLSDAATGYTWNFFHYRGKDERRPANQSATLYPVLKLTEEPDLYRKDHIVYHDNWYTQLDGIIALKLPPRKMDVCGTVKANKKGLPKSSIFKKTGAGAKNRGTIECRSIVSPEGVQIYFTAWADNKPVHMLSTWKPNYTMVTRRVKEQRTGVFKEIVIPRPTTTGSYNQGMGGVDNGDQKASYYNPRLRTKRWMNRKICHWLIQAAINAHILYKDHTNTEMTILDFFIGIISDWCGFEAELSNEGDYDGDVEDSQTAYSRHHMSTWDKLAHVRLQGEHYPLRFERTKGSETEPGIDGRGQCKICRMKSMFKCDKCDVWLCIQSNTRETCWKHFHSAENLKS